MGKQVHTNGFDVTFLITNRQNHYMPKIVSRIRVSPGSGVELRSEQAIIVTNDTI